MTHKQTRLWHFEKQDYEAQPDLALGVSFGRESEDSAKPVTEPGN